MACAKATAYRIAPGRGFDDIKPLLKESYDGILVRDGWAPYRSYTEATHQSCVAHLARRCHELNEELPRFESGFASRISAILDEALAWRDEDRPGDERADAAADLHDRLLTVCGGTIIADKNKRFAK